jgi:hypothetical protein
VISHGGEYRLGLDHAPRIFAVYYFVSTSRPEFPMDRALSAYDQETQRLERLDRRISRVSVALIVALRILTFLLQ